MSWYCNECGQDSSVTSSECEICGVARSKTGVSTITEITKSAHKETFEIDGELVKYVEKGDGDDRIAKDWVEISRIKKEQGL